MGNGKQTRERLIVEALELFVQGGYHGTSIDNIVRKVGLTKGAFYSHFSSKGELLLEIIERYKTTSLKEMIRITSNTPGNALEKLQQIISFNARFATENENLCVFLTFLTFELNKDVDFEDALKAVYREYTEYITKLIREGMEQGILRKTLDAKLAALTFLALHDGTLHQWILNRKTIHAETYVQTFRDIFFNGLCKDGEG